MNEKILIIIEELLQSKQLDAKLKNMTNELYESIKNKQEYKIYSLIQKIVRYASYKEDMVKNKDFLIIIQKLFKYMNFYFNISKEEEIIMIAQQQYLNNSMSLEEYFRAIDGLYEIKKFDGKLSDDELKALLEAGFSNNEIDKINGYLEKYKDSLSGFKDLVGDTLVPNKKLFFFLMDHFGYLLNNDQLVTVKDVNIRRKVNPLIKAIGKNFLPNGQRIENRDVLRECFDNNITLEDKPNTFKDKGITLPNEPVIYVINHGFKDDTLATILACPRHAYILFGNCAQFYNTIDGVLSHLNGIFHCNRKVQASKSASVKKAINAMKCGADLVVFPEAIWDKSPNKPVLELWQGFYAIAKETKAKIVPMVHYIKDAANNENTIHTVIDDPISIDNLSANEAKELIKEKFSTWIMMMASVYGTSTRKYALDGFDTPHKAWENHLREITSQVERFDSEAEHFADYRSLTTECLNPVNVWEPIANTVPQSEQNNNEICKLVRTLKQEDYQRRI